MMKRAVVAIIALAVSILGGDDAKGPKTDDAARADLKALAGTWATVGGEVKGAQISKDDLPFRWTFRAGGKLVFADLKQGTESTSAFTLDASETPKEIDLTYEGHAEALKGARQYGIYKLEGDELVLCLTQPGAAEEDRPKGFSTKEGEVMLWRLECARTTNAPQWISLRGRAKASWMSGSAMLAPREMRRSGENE